MSNIGSPALNLGVRPALLAAAEPTAAQATAKENTVSLIDSNELCPEQLHDMLETINSCWSQAHGYYMSSGTHDRYESMTDLQKDLDSNEVYGYYDQNGNIAGSIIFDPDYSEKECYFGTLWVDPNYQGQGIGSKLMKHIDAQAKKSGKSHLRIHVVECDDKLKKIYSKKGFNPTGELLDRNEGFLKSVKTEFKDRVSFVVMNKEIHPASVAVPEGKKAVTRPASEIPTRTPMRRVKTFS